MTDIVNVLSPMMNVRVLHTKHIVNQLFRHVIKCYSRAIATSADLQF